MEATKRLKVELNEERLRELTTDGYHQTIINIMYDYWKITPKLTYSEALEWLKTKYGTLAQFAVLVGKYNQQVTNGGHYQYYQNGYGDGKGGCFCDHDTTIPLHKTLIKLLIEVNLQDEISQKVLDIMKRLEIELDDDYEVENTWLLNDLDTEYYEVYEKFMELLEEYFKTKINEPLQTKSNTTTYLIVEKNHTLNKSYIMIDDEGDAVLFEDLTKATQFAQNECIDGLVVEIKG